jgi:hypothetical protein
VWQWLIKLGWHWTVKRKEVHMDGHKREDVVKYWQEVFLLAMARFEACMVNFEGEELKQVDFILEMGSKKIIVLFHDKCCLMMKLRVCGEWFIFRVLNDI